MQIEFPPHLCNKKCPSKTKTGYRLSPQSYISIPPGTRLEIFVNEDPNDPESDCVPVKTITTNTQHVFAILTDKLSVKTDKEI
jgi:hypothetical protein